MLYLTPPPVEVGEFFVDEASKIAAKIRNGEYPVSESESSGRFILNVEADVQLILGQVGLQSTIDDRAESSRNRVYAQDLSKIHPPSFIGLPWHIDTSEDESGETHAFDFNFGSSSHPTEVLVGELDLKDSSEFVSEYFERDDMHVSKILYWSKQLTQSAVERGVKSGSLEVRTLEPGKVYEIPAGAVHRMQPYDSETSYPIRFCIEQYRS